ncbi:MAG: hypothetical protein ACFB5Z_00450 [Elainellaceae cyanobacterium]
MYVEVNKDNIDTDFFRDRKDDQPLIDYMISYTLNRPRDLLNLCKKAIGKAEAGGVTHIFPRHIEQALDDYSIERVIALEDEWKASNPGIENLISLDLVTMEQEFAALAGRDIDLIEKRVIENSDNPIRKREILNSAQIIYSQALPCDPA